MARLGMRMSDKVFERLLDRVAAATARCSDDQLLDLADSLHATLRRRRETRERGGERHMAG